MSSVERRIEIEEYVDGGYGIFEHGKEDIMGIHSKYNVIKAIMRKLDGDEE